MNKLFIFFLAVCLVSVHGFVRRDAPAAATPNQNSLDDFAKKVQDGANEFGKKVAEVFSQDNINKFISDVQEGAKKLGENFQPKNENKS